MSLKPKPIPAACSCPEHVRDGAPREIGAHRYRPQVDEFYVGDWKSYRWRARCTCGRGRGSDWNYQSDSVAYHAWRRHVEKWS